MSYPTKEWYVETLRKSKDKTKKYDCIIACRKKPDVKRIVPFGNIEDTHYYDNTPLKFYQYLNTYNMKERNKDRSFEYITPESLEKYYLG